MKAPAFPGAEQAAPFVDRWVGIQRAALSSALARCESPIETLFALALLSARDDRGLLFALYHPSSIGVPLAIGRGGEVTPQYNVRIDGKLVRLDFAIMQKDKQLAVELDGHAYHASAPARSADAARDLALTKAGWIPVRFTGSDIWHDADGCAARTLDLLGFNVTRDKSVKPLRASGQQPTMTPEDAITHRRQGAARVLAALSDDSNGPRERNR